MILASRLAPEAPAPAGAFCMGATDRPGMP